MDLDQLQQSICQSPLLKPDFYSNLICQVHLLMAVFIHAHLLRYNKNKLHVQVHEP